MINVILRALISALRSRGGLAAENLALRHQLNVLQRNVKKPRIHRVDRLLWVLLLRFWKGWRESLTMVRSETVIRWHREGFRLYWRWRSRPKRPGRPKVPREVRNLIGQISDANPTWGAPRIHGELLKLGIEIGQATVSKYMIRRRKPPSQTWRTFLENHAQDMVSIDFFTVPTATFRVFFVFLIWTSYPFLLSDTRTDTSPARLSFLTLRVKMGYTLPFGLHNWPADQKEVAMKMFRAKFARVAVCLLTAVLLVPIVSLSARAEQPLGTMKLKTFDSGPSADGGFIVLRLTGTAEGLGECTCYSELDAIDEFHRTGVAVFTSANGDTLVGVISAERDTEGAYSAEVHWRDSVTLHDDTTVVSTGRFVRNRPAGVKVQHCCCNCTWPNCWCIACC